MLKINELFSAEELLMMNNWVARYGGGAHPSDRISVERLLSQPRCWAESKENLYKVFGEKLILSKDVSYSVPESELSTKIYKELAPDRDMYAFSNQVLNYTWDIIPTLSDSNEITAWCYVRQLFNSYTLARNTWEGETFKLSNPTSPGKYITVQRGSKVIKALGKIAEAYKFSSFEEFRLAHSRILNQAKLTGKLCLSIHPFDYMTMSDNSLDWNSCMSWTNYGCYRRGTVEMMNSPIVVVAYLQSEHDMRVIGGTWNNKKWRSLIVIHPYMITSIKGYPYQSEELSKIAVTWLAELSNQNCGTDYDISTLDGFIYCEGSFLNRSKELNYLIVMECNSMYNDFGAVDFHYCLFATHYLKDPERLRQINYSGATQCVWCGSIYVDFGEEEWLVCDECGEYSATSQCPNCDSFVNEDELYYVDGETFCSCCISDHTGIDAITCERRLYDNLSTIYLVIDEFNDKRSWVYRVINTSTENINKNIAFPFYEIEDESDEYYCKATELTPEQLRLFGLYNETDVKNYAQNIDF